MTPDEAWIAARAATRRTKPPPLAPSPPIRPYTPPGRLSFGRVLVRRLAHANFVRRVMALHQVDVAGACSCGINAVLCPYVRLAREVLGYPPPPAPQAPPPRPSPHQVEFRPPPRPYPIQPPRPYQGEL